MKKYKIEKFFGGWFLYKRLWCLPFIWLKIDVFFSERECLEKIGNLESFTEHRLQTY
jgi:hypothetical protein